jgi:hypothetical protein
VLHIDTQMPQESARDENGEEEMGCEIGLIPMGLSYTDCRLSSTVEVPILISMYECGP